MSVVRVRAQALAGPTADSWGPPGACWEARPGQGLLPPGLLSSHPFPGPRLFSVSTPPAASDILGCLPRTEGSQASPGAVHPKLLIRVQGLQQESVKPGKGSESPASPNPPHFPQRVPTRSEEQVRNTWCLQDQARFHLQSHLLARRSEPWNPLSSLTPAHPLPRVTNQDTCCVFKKPHLTSLNAART